MRPESLIEKTAAAVSAVLKGNGDGSEDASQETVLRALHYLFDTLEEDILDDWEECLVGTASLDIPWRFKKSMDWVRSHYPDCGP